jgi:hypothetical protein
MHLSPGPFQYAILYLLALTEHRVPSERHAIETASYPSSVISKQTRKTTGDTAVTTIAYVMSPTIRLVMITADVPKQITADTIPII